MSGLFFPGEEIDERIRTPAVKPATMGETFSAGRVLARGDRMDAEAERLRRGYEPLLAEINADRARRGEKPLVNPGAWVGDWNRRPSADRGTFDVASIADERVTRPQQQARIFAELREIRKRDPGFLAGVPDDDASFQSQLIAQERDARTAARSTLARASGVSGTLASFAGGVAETVQDPVNLFSLPLGGGGKTVVSQIARSALVNGGLELIQQPQVALNREDLGEELTLGEAALNTSFAAVGGALFEVGVPQAAKAIGKGADAAYRRLRPNGYIASALARADLPDDALAARFAELVPETIRSFDEQAALHVITREAEVRGASPFVPTPAGHDAHAARLQASIDAILAAQPSPAPALRGTLPNVSQGTGRPIVRAGGVASDVVGFFRAKGYSEAQARGIAAGIHAEAASNHGAVNPTSGALGLGQWLGPRKAELIRRYGPRPTREQQLEFLHWELQGGDAGGRAVLAGADDAAVLDAYVRAFMRPAAGAETDGDIARGMAALGREGETPARILDEDAGAIMRPAELDAMRGPIDGPELVELDMPELRRDLFSDEGSWREAQAMADGEALGLPAAPDRAIGGDPNDAGRVRYQRSIADLWRHSLDDLDALHGRALDQEREMLREAIRRSGVRAPDRLNRLIENGAIERAANTLQDLLDKHFDGAVPDDIDRLVSPRWEDHPEGGLPNSDDISALQQAHVNAADIDGNTPHALASEIGWALRDLSEGDLAAVARGEGSITSQAAMVTLNRGYAAMKARGFTSEEMPAAIEAAMIANGVRPDTAAELTHRLFEMLSDDTGPRVRAGVDSSSLALLAPSPRALVQVAPAVRDALDAAAPSPVPPRQLDLFDDPAGEGASLQADSLVHDLRAALDVGDGAAAGRAYRLEDGSEKTGAQILADLDEDEAMLATIRGCL